MPSQWVGYSYGSALEAYEEGNLFDRTIYSLLIVMAAWVLMRRALRWSQILSRNLALVWFLAIALLSVTWSDFPFVAFKRWVRDLGQYVMILVVLTDPRPLSAIETLLRRFSYALVPLSVVFVKYYPHLGRGYNAWTGAPQYTGVTTNKNLLGVVCLVSATFFFWDSVKRWSERRQPRTKRILMLNALLIGMSLWLLDLADSATSRLCLVLACLVILAAHSRRSRANPSWLKWLIPSVLGLYLALDFGFNITELIAAGSGRDATFTGRTEVWKDVVRLVTNPLLGAGYESFWLGDRLQWMWARHEWRPNQAHNGYLEVYLNLGLVGLCALAGVLIATYREICRQMTHPVASLGLAFFAVLIFYNVTEAAFKGHLLWFVLLLVSIAIPRPSAGEGISRATEQATVAAATEAASIATPFRVVRPGRPAR
jgi:O-antigen ligase